MNKSNSLRRLLLVAVISGLFLSTPNLSQAQETDSAKVYKEYPYILPILGKKAFEKGHKLQLPFGGSVGTIFNKQGLILENFEMTIADPNTPGSDLNYKDLTGILDFGPSVGRINTLNFRVDTWLLPFYLWEDIMVRCGVNRLLVLVWLVAIFLKAPLILLGNTMGLIY